MKYTDFTSSDKANFVEIFVTHHESLTHFYDVLFPRNHLDTMKSNR